MAKREKWTNQIPTTAGKYLFRSHPWFEAREFELRKAENGELVVDIKEAMRVFDTPTLNPQWRKL